ncbi:hypothetical protein A2U01_0001116 [Trifolium medium]|uniref:Uncharacterized protein n=1 Tax=Trifolium medium TaxID=97028 RepID=A0A392LZB8_9FABA|nr:hypothetical protein [Trifolium medium]
MSSNIRDGLSYSGTPPPPPPARSQRSPAGSSQMQQGMAYNNDLRPEGKTGSQKTQTLSAEGLSYSNTNN